MALALAPEGIPSATAAVAGTSRPPNASPAALGRKKPGVVVTLGDDSVTQQTVLRSLGTQQSAPAGTSAGAGTTGTVGGGGGGAGGILRSPCVLKFWAGADMGFCVRAVDVAAQMRAGQQQRWAAGAAGQFGATPAATVPRLTAFAVTPDASQVIGLPCPACFRGNFAS